MSTPEEVRILDLSTLPSSVNRRVHINRSQLYAITTTAFGGLLEQGAGNIIQR
jgi:hypothetical protein